MTERRIFESGGWGYTSPWWVRAYVNWSIGDEVERDERLFIGRRALDRASAWVLEVDDE